jgi:V/A-type H+-transporting ATPase subunit I
MIVKMKKLTLLCTRSSQEKTLAALRELGVLHVESVHMPEGGDLEQARNHLVYVRRALEVLQKHPHIEPSDEPVDAVIENVWTLIHQRVALEEKHEMLRMEQQRLAPFGEFDPDAVRDLAHKGIAVRFFQASAKEKISMPEGCVLKELSRDRGTVTFAVISRAGVELNVQEMPLPGHSPTVVREQIAKAEHDLVRIDEAFCLYAGDHSRVAAVVQQSEDTVRYLEVKAGMGEEGPVTYLQGFFPCEQESAVRKAADMNGWAALIRDIAEGDDPPTLLRSPKWVRPINAVFQMIGVSPGYHEVDISAVFLIFFSLFFAMLVGDAGYGILFLVLTLIGKQKFRKAPQDVFNLLLITSVSTIIWGVLTGTYFGLSNIPAPLKQLRLGWLTGPEADAHIMWLCFLIGAVHLTIAHAWNTFRIINTWQALAQIGWIGSTWTMFFAARTLVLNAPFPPVMLWVLAVSVVLILFFMTPVNKIKSEWFNYVILPLNIVSNFVDVVSYVRLFAVGVASFALANAFNQMALDVGFNSFLSGLGAVMIIFFSHLLNIVLSAMGIMVHGIRLNTLEFSGHIGVQWAGRKYDPFRKISATDV